MSELLFVLIVVVILGTLAIWWFSRLPRKKPSWIKDKQESNAQSKQISETEKGKKGVEMKKPFILSLNVAVAIVCFIFVGSKIKIIKESKDIYRESLNIIDKYNQGSPISRTILAKDLISSINSDWEIYRNMSLSNEPSHEKWIPRIWKSVIKRKLTLFKIDMSTSPELDENNFEVLKWEQVNWIDGGDGEFENRYLIKSRGENKNKFRVWAGLGLNKTRLKSLDEFVDIYVRKPGQGSICRPIDINENSMLLGVKNGESSFFMIEIPLEEDDFDEQGRTEVIKRIKVRQLQSKNSRLLVEFSLGSPEINRYRKGVKELVLAYNFQDPLISHEVLCFDPTNMDVINCDLFVSEIKHIQDKALWGFGRKKIKEYWSYKFYATAPQERPIIAFRQKQHTIIDN